MTALYHNFIISLVSRVYLTVLITYFIWIFYLTAHSPYYTVPIPNAVRGHRNARISHHAIHAFVLAFPLPFLMLSHHRTIGSISCSIIITINL
jgi:hypothetical protein